MASHDHSPRLSEGASTVRTVQDIILRINQIREQLEGALYRNRKYLNAAKARRRVDNGEASRGSADAA
jgi:hypothetical protein